MYLLAKQTHWRHDLLKNVRKIRIEQTNEFKYYTQSWNLSKNNVVEQTDSLNIFTWNSNFAECIRSKWMKQMET